MGNRSSCCVYASPSVGRKPATKYNETQSNRDDFAGNLQHISEREPEDWDTDPSLHPKAKTIFLERSKIESKLEYRS